MARHLVGNKLPRIFHVHLIRTELTLIASFPQFLADPMGDIAGSVECRQSLSFGGWFRIVLRLIHDRLDRQLRMRQQIQQTRLLADAESLADMRLRRVAGIL